MKKKLRPFLTALFLSMLPFLSAWPDSSSCNLFFQGSRLCAQLQWINGPLVSKDSPFVLGFFNREDGREFPLADLELTVKLWMPDMNHGSSPVRFERKGPSTFQINRVYFTMPGLWEIRFSVKERGGDRSADLATWPVNL